MNNKLYFILLSIITSLCIISTALLVIYTIYVYKNASIIAFISNEWW